MAVSQAEAAQHVSLKILSSEQLAQYHRDGFLILDNFVQQDQCELLIQRASYLIDNFNPDSIKTVFSTLDPKHAQTNYFLESGDKIHFFFEAGAMNAQGELIKEKQFSINKIGHALHDLDPIFNLFSRQHKLAQLSQDLAIHDPRLMQSMYICKQPRIGGEVTCHQDATYLFVEGQPVTGFWFALEDATIENGCLWAIPGAHHTPLKSRMRRQGQGVKTEVYDATPWSLDKMVPLEVKRGSLVVLHGLLPHMSYENTSSKSRHAYALHVVSHRYHYPADNWLQREEHVPAQGF